jgi:fatty-acyl-CoA synthase
MHTRYRLLVNKGFTPRRVAELEKDIRERTTAILDRVHEEGKCDFVTDVAAELPLQVIADLMGVPQEDRHLVFDWSNRMVGANDPEYGDTTGAQGQMAAMHALLQHPDQFADLVADESLLAGAVEEMLRWASPVMCFRRTAMKDTDVNGHPVKAGDKIVIWYISANRDERVFDDPQVFDIRRTPNPHVAFGGGGPHFCLGANLARLEIRVMFEEICRRLPDMHSAGPVERLRSNFINGIKHLPVAFG